MTSRILCRYFMNGTCNKGDNCTFSHSKTDSPSNVCSFYQRGVCSYGDKCRYDHVKLNRGSTAVAPAGKAVPSRAPGQTQVAPIGLSPASSRAMLHSGGSSHVNQLPPAIAFQVGRSAPSASAAPFVPGGFNPGQGQGSSTSGSFGYWSQSPAGPSQGWSNYPLPPPRDCPSPSTFSLVGTDEFDADFEAEAAAFLNDFGVISFDDDGESAEVELDEGFPEEEFEQFCRDNEAKTNEGQREGAAAAPNNTVGQFGRPNAWVRQPAQSIVDFRAANPELNGRTASAGEVVDHASGGAKAVERQGAEQEGERPLCSKALLGECPEGNSCPNIHGDRCQTCGKNCLHPDRPEEREAHKRTCEHAARQLAALRLSQTLECSICLERVLAKPRAAERKFGILSGCEHPFCLGCIRSWRGAEHAPPGMDLGGVVRACPVCRVPSHLVTPSVVWYTSPEERQDILEGYKRKLMEIDCMHFANGEGTCPFGTSCFYKHAYKDGSLEVVSLRHLAAADGNTVIAKELRLSEFLGNVLSR